MIRRSRIVDGFSGAESDSPEYYVSAAAGRRTFLAAARVSSAASHASMPAPVRAESSRTVIPACTFSMAACAAARSKPTASGARPRALMATFVLEAGLPAETLRDEVAAMAAAAERAGVAIVGGDTKVVEHGFCDGMYVTTFGLGEVEGQTPLDPRAVRAGDRVLLSGPVGDHGITILLARGELEIESSLRSDTRPVWPFVEALLRTYGAGVRWMRDPTRGGVATALNELVRENGLAVVLDEAAIPLRSQVRGACELLGLDPLHIANEGQFLALLAPDIADAALELMRAVPGGEEAALIGEVRDEPARTVLCVTPYGGTRTIDMLVGDPLPRIC